jgi:[ribosomal protein S5]-alanine N-acetyltransferase
MHPIRRAVLRTARLVLRPVVAADEAAIVAAIDDIAISGWLSTVPHPYTAEDFRFFLHEIAKPGETFALDDLHGFAGVLGLEGGELGYWLAPRAQGLGYATEAGYATLDAHFADGGDTVVAGYFEGNARSARVLDKLGFVETGRRPRRCAALRMDRPHVDLILTRAAWLTNLTKA